MIADFCNTVTYNNFFEKSITILLTKENHFLLSIDDVKKNQCGKEFTALMDCIRINAKKMKTKL